MEIIILIVIICVVVSKAKAAQKRQGTRPNVPRQQVRPNRQARPTQSYQTPQQAYRAAKPNYARPQQVRPNQQARPAQSYQAPQQAHRAAQPNYAGLQQRGDKQRAQSNDILARAAANVNENERDELETQMLDGGRTLANAIDIDETSALMKEVSDLMIMGYRADLSFERDFVAEGVAMLNSYELPAGN